MKPLKKHPLLNQKRKHLATIEAQLNMSITIHADNTINNPNFTIDLNKAPGTSDEHSPGKVITMDGAKAGNQEDFDLPSIPDATSGNLNRSTEGIGRKQKRRRRRNNRNKQGDSNTTQSLESFDKSVQKPTSNDSTEKHNPITVSYTHLTLPTNREV